MRYNSVLSEIAHAQQRVLKAEQQVSSGKKVTKPSDDPMAAADILRINSDKRETDQYLRNLTFAKSKLQFTDGVLDSIEKVVERAVTIGQLSFGSPDQRAAYATELEGLRDQLISNANTAYAGRFIFGGSLTTQDPYVKNPDSSVTYNGNSEQTPLQISRTVSVQTQVPGSELFSGSVNIFDVMQDLVTAIQAGDKDGIDAGIGSLEQFSQAVSLAHTKVGGYMNLTANVESDHSSAKLAYETELTNKEAADLAKAITELTASQNSLQATLAVGANVAQLSILDYLK
jgi:flagellar hook-associated protein 3 FlgL